MPSPPRMRNYGLVLLLAGIVFCSMPASAQGFNTEPWLQDFRQLLAEISSHYANLEWVANERRIDLPKLKNRTEERLRQATSDAEAQRAIERFLRAFGDAHVEIRWQRKAEHNSSAPAGPLCERLGYNERDDHLGIDWSIFPEYSPLQDAASDDFPGGILRTPAGRKIGVVRIGLFSEHAHPALCAQAQRQLGMADDAKCEGECEDHFEFAVGDLLTAALEGRLKLLRESGADSILVDITGNGGGTGWPEPAARVLTPIPLHSPPFGFVRHEHWTVQLKEKLANVEADLPQATPADRPLLASAANILREAIAQTTAPCDRSVLWTGPPSALHCSQVVTGLLYTSGVLPYAKPGSFRGLKSASVLFGPAASYQYNEGANRLPVMVLVDGNTGSSAEYFAAMLQDNKAATIVGGITAGAGCGFTNGGIPTVLKNSGAQVRLPDCLRFRADGSDEVAGVTPDVLLPWAERDSRYQQSVKLKRWLETADFPPKKK